MTSGTLAEGRSRRYYVKPSPCDRWERCGRGPTRRTTATIASVCLEGSLNMTRGHTIKHRHTAV
eukprot:scaffold2329_cov155-Isochrysis_galbana.AAC.1